MSSLLSVASVSRVLPTPDEPTTGVFVMRRLQAMASVLSLRILQPVPYFPVLRPLPAWCRGDESAAAGEKPSYVPMFYLPRYLKRLDSFWLYRSILSRLQALKQRSALDVIDAHFGYPDGVGCLRAARSLGVPVVVTVRGVEEEQLGTAAIARQLRRMVKHVDGLICVSHSLRASMMDIGAEESRTAVVHNAVDRAVFAPGDQAAARERLGVSKATPIVLSVGNLLKVKGHDTLIQAFARAEGRARGAELVVIGGVMHEPMFADRLQEICREAGVADRVRFLGRQPEAIVADWLKAADAFALASRREGCCNAVLEALSSGLPVVATAVGDNAWFVKDGVNGQLTPPDDAAGLAAALQLVLDRTDWDRHRISSALEVGSWPAAARAISDFLNETVARRARQGDRRVAPACADKHRN